MRKIFGCVGVVALLLTLFGVGVLIADRVALREDIIRLHVIANSDREEDQRIKLSVRDAIVSYLQHNISQLNNAQEVKMFLQQRLPRMEELANNTLTALGSDDRANVYLTTERFGVREYDTFTLPSGVYDSLRVEIGQAQGKNWWCVAFPSLCLPASQDGFEEVAVSSGFNDTLINTLTETDGYEIRFFLLDCFGKIENFFFFS